MSKIEKNKTENYIPTPDEIDTDGLLVGWSLEHEKKIKKKAGPGFINDQQAIDIPEALSPILHKGPGHLMTIASTGAGKGVGCIIPALLRHDGPVVVIDPKGENYAVTARARREMGQQVILLDPFQVTGETKTDRLNPLDLILKFEGAEIEQCKMIADMIVIKNPNNKDPFWDKRAEQFITGLLLYILEQSPLALQNLTELRYLLNQTTKNLEITVKEMGKSSISEVKLLARAIAGTEPKVLASILSTAQYHTDFIAGDLFAQATSSTTFDLEDIIKGSPLSIYIVIPPDKIDTSAQLIRLWLGTLLTLIMMRHSAPQKRTLFILDEAAQLGHMTLLTKAITLLRGYGLQTWSFWQDLSQLSSLYPNWETLYNNCRVHQDFGITNARFARQVASITDYPYYREILKLDNDEMLLQIAGDETVIAQRPNYLTDALFTGMTDPNPYHCQDDDDELKPRHAQRRYKRRKKRDFSKISEISDLHQELKTAIAEAKQAMKEAREVKQRLEKGADGAYSKTPEELLKILKKQEEENPSS
jgi:type IV secretion system protein VirD4